MTSRFTVLVGACLALPACKLASEYHCTASAQCVFGEFRGFCEASGWCSFPDGTCDSGRRYGKWAPAGVAHTCAGQVLMVEDLGISLDADSDGGGDAAGAAPDLERLKNRGEACAPGDACLSGLCRDGYCCDVDCADACHACNLPGFEGTCSPVATGAMPAAGHPGCGAQSMATCGRDGTCDGSGACRLWSAGTVCVASSCSSGTNQYTPASTCDGNGACAGGTAISCAPYVCKDTTVCWDSCTGTPQCSGTNTCNAGSCGLKGNGASCGADGQCASNHCAQGVCCATTCGGTCMSCALSAHLGTCYPVPSTQPDPQGGCAAGSGLNAVCAPGGCDGAGHCRYAGTATICRAAGCSTVSNYETFQANCNGSGSCTIPNPSTKTCAPYLCGATACKTTCSGPGDCIAGDVCPSGSCVAGPPPSLCASAGTLLCEGFEGSLSGAWVKRQDDGVITIDSSRAYRGSSSLKMHLNPVPNRWGRIDIKTDHTMGPLPQNLAYVRIFAWWPSTVPIAQLGDGVELIDYYETTDGQGAGVRLNRSPAWSFELQPPNAASSTLSATLDQDTWVCLELQVAVSSNKLSLLKSDSQVGTTGVNPPIALDSLSIGVAASSFFNNASGFDIWIDEVAVDNKPIGCAK